MSLSSTSKKQLSYRPRPPALSRIDTAAWRDVHKALSFPKYVPITVQRLLVTIQHLLLTNDSPSCQDSVIIAECVRLIDDQVAKLDALNPAAITMASIAIPRICAPPFYMTSTQSPFLTQPRTPRSELLRVREQVQSLNSAVRRLPPELWQEVFVRLGDTQLRVFNPQDPVYIPGRVCQKWRRLSQSCPRLWSHIYIDVTPAMMLLPSSYVSRLREVLKRSGNVSLDFILDCSEQGTLDQSCHELRVALLDVLKECSSQWRLAHFHYMTFSEVLVLDDVRGRVPRLDSLILEVDAKQVKTDEEGDKLEYADILSAFEIAPNLSRVRLWDLPLGQVSLDPQNLQSLTVTHNVAEEYLMFSGSTPSLSDILRQSPNLTDINISCNRIIEQNDASNLPGNWPTLPPQADAPRFVHPNVSSLVIAGGGDSIHFVSLPNLVRLSAGAVSSTTLMHCLVPCVIGFLQHSRCRLITLELKFPSWDEESIGVLLELLPELDSLTIQSDSSLPGVDAMFRALVSHLAAMKDSDSGPKYLPRLKTAVIHLSDSPDSETPPRWAFVDEAFSDMLSMRGEHGLETFRLFDECDSDDIWSNGGGVGSIGENGEGRFA